MKFHPQNIVKSLLVPPTAAILCGAAVGALTGSSQAAPAKATATKATATKATAAKATAKKATAAKAATLKVTAPDQVPYHRSPYSNLLVRDVTPTPGFAARSMSGHIMNRPGRKRGKSSQVSKPKP